MAKLYNLARMTTATTGTGTITLGSAVLGYLTFAQAGVTNGDVVDYAIRDGANSEHGTGTYTSSGTTLTRAVTKSTNSNSAISLSGSAEVFISTRAETLNDASLFTTGTVASARLGSGGAGAGAKFLADDQTFKTLTNSGLVQVNVYTSTQTVTIPTGATRGRFRMGGASGGGGGVDSGGGSGLGGGGAGGIEKWLTGLTPGNTLAFTSGAAGTAGNTSGSAGGNGGSSTLASGTQTITTLTASGGGGGSGTAASSNPTGGTGTNGDLNVTGQDGGWVGAGNPTNGKNPGGYSAFGLSVGGNGGKNSGGSSAGVAGTAGVLIAEWYY